MSYDLMEQVGRLRDEDRLREAEHARLVREMRRLHPPRSAALLARLRRVAARVAMWLRQRRSDSSMSDGSISDGSISDGSIAET